MAAAVAQLVILMLPTAPHDAPISKIPSIPELVGREAIYRAALTRIGEQVPWDARILYVTDYPDVTFSRQLPVHHPGLHSMIIHSEYWPIFNDTTLGLVTQNDWIPVPGPILLQSGPPTVRDVPFAYDLVVIGLVASADLRDELRKHTDCHLGDADDEPRASVLPARSCFPNGIIEVHGQGIRFQLSDPPAATGATEPTTHIESESPCLPFDVHYLNHASLLVEVGGVRMLFDPWLEGTAFSGGWGLRYDNPDATRIAANRHTPLDLPLA